MKNWQVICNIFPLAKSVVKDYLSKEEAIMLCDEYNKESDEYEWYEYEKMQLEKYRDEKLDEILI